MLYLKERSTCIMASCPSPIALGPLLQRCPRSPRVRHCQRPQPVRARARPGNEPGSLVSPNMAGCHNLASCARLSAPVRRIGATLGSDPERRRRAGVGGGRACRLCLFGANALSTPTLAQCAKPRSRVAAATHLTPHRLPSIGPSTLTPIHLVGTETDIFAEQLADIIAEQ